MGKLETGKGFHTWKPNCSKEQRAGSPSLIHLSHLHQKSNEPELLIHHHMNLLRSKCCIVKTGFTPVCRMPEASATPSVFNSLRSPADPQYRLLRGCTSLPPSSQAPKLGQTQLLAWKWPFNTGNKAGVQHKESLSRTSPLHQTVTSKSHIPNLSWS